MQYLKFTDFRNRSKEYFDLIEKGESFIIIRKGTPVAQISPFETKRVQGWKRAIKKVKLKKNISTLRFIAEERSDR